MKIGIPKSMFFYSYSGIFKNFFDNLGLETVLSPATNNEIFKMGKKKVMDEFCLPLKVLVGHVMYLKKQGVSRVFIPIIIGNKNQKSFLCFNQIRSFDIVKNLDIVDNKSILTGTFNYSDSGLLSKGFYEVGMKCGFNQNQVKEALEKIDEKFSIKKKQNSLKSNNKFKTNNQLTVGLLGHSYVIDDNWISNNIKESLKNLNCNLITEKNYPDKERNTNSHFTFTGEVINTFNKMNEDNRIDGIINLIPFNCGPDSGVELIARNKGLKKPYIKLVVDETRGRAGMMTRLEAFLDIIRMETQVQKNTK